MTESWELIGPLLIVGFGGLAMMLVDAFSKAKAELSIVTCVIMLAAASMSLGLWFTGPDTVEAGTIGSYLAYDKLAHVLDLIICGSTALAALLAGGYLREHRIERGELYVIMLFSAFGAMTLARAVDLLTVFIALETMSLGIYGLVAYRRASPRAAEGALKYFLLGSFASAILLFGMALLYGASGHTSLAEISAVVGAGDAEPTILILSMLLILTGLAFKVSAVPFHAWTPDAYEGAVTPVTTYMAVVVKAAVFGVMIRILFSAYGSDELATTQTGWPPAIAALAALTLVVGSLSALGQKSVKRMLAYSSISHAGFMLLGVLAAWNTEGGVGLSSVLFYLMTYAVSNILAFGSLILVGSHGKEAVTYEDLAGVGRRHPLVAVPFTLGILSLLGFPPLAGFFGKYYVLLAVIQGGGELAGFEYGMVWLALLAVLSSAVGVYYYLRVLVFLFMKTPEEGAPVAVPMRSGYVVAALVVAGYFVVRLGVTPGPYLALTEVVGDAAPTLDWMHYLIDGGVALVAGAIGAALTSIGASPDDAAEASSEAAPSA